MQLGKKLTLKFFIIIDPDIGSCHYFEVLHCNYNGAIGPKMRFGHNFWLEVPINIRPTRLICILQDLFRDTPLEHIWRYQIRAQICQIWPNMPNMHIWVHIWVHIWARKIWSCGVSLKRSCKMQFRRVGLRSIGPSSQKLWQNQIFGRFPHCNYNVKLKIAPRMSCMGL